MTKIDPRTAARSEKMRQIVVQLRKGRMTAADVSQFLNTSIPASREYLRQLTLGGAAYIATRMPSPPGTTGKPIFEITSDEGAIQRFLAQLDEGGIKHASRITRGAPTNFSKAIKDPSRHIHLAADDEPTYPRVRNIAPAKADPQALPREFFAPPRVAAEPRVKAPRLPEPAGFAALAVRFERRVG